MKCSRIFINSSITALFLLVLVIVVRLPSISQPLDNDSGAIAYHARLILQGEPLYGTHHPNHHLPAAYYIYAFVFKFLGDRPESLKIFLIPWVWITSWVVFLIGKNLSGNFTGCLAAILFILCTSTTNLMGDSAEIELWANLPLTFCIWLGIIGIQKQQQPLVFLSLGVFASICFLLKAVYLSSITAVCATLLLKSILENRKGAWRRLFIQVTEIMVGVVILLGSVAIYFQSIGLWNRLFIVFQFGSMYVGDDNEFKPLYFMFISPMTIITYHFITLTLFGMISTSRILLFLKKTISTNLKLGLYEFMLLIWLFASIVASGLSKLPYPHYTLLLLPPLSLLCANEISRIRQRFPRSSFIRNSAITSVLVIILISNIIYSSRNYIGGYLKYLTGQYTNAEFVRNGVWFGNSIMDATEIAEYLQLHTTADDHIFGWTNFAQIYYTANRRSSSDVLWPSYVPLLGNPERVFNTKPIYILVDSRVSDLPDWLVMNLQQSYQFETSINRVQIYRRSSTLIK